MKTAKEMETLGRPETFFVLTAADLEEAFRRIASQVEAERQNQQKGSKLTRKAVSERLGVDVSTLWRWDKSGYLRAMHQGRSVFYWEADVKRIERGEG